MNNIVNILLHLLQQEEVTKWVAYQVENSYSQGISMNVKEALLDQNFKTAEPTGLTIREKQKREKYETTRSYSDEEKFDLLQKALKTLFVDLPAIQVAGMEGLQNLGSNASTIRFVPPDEPEQGRDEYYKDLDKIRDNQLTLVKNFNEFNKEINS